MSTGGQVVGGVVGAVAGFLLGGGPTGALYGAQIGIMAGGYLDPPKGPTVTGPRLNDLTVQTSTYGAVIPRVYGTVTVNGNVIWLQGNALTEVVTKKKSGGKGGGSKTTTKTFTYSATFAVGLCEGPVVGVRRIWVGPDLIYDAGSTDPDTIAASNASAEGFALYLGTNTQAPDPRIQADVGVDNAPAWRGLAYIVFYDFALARYSNSLMGAQVRVEVVKNGSFGNYVASYGSFTNTRNWSYQSPTSWSGSAFLSLAGGTAICATSPDGLVWTEHALPVSGTWRGNAFGDGLFVIGMSNDHNYIYTSPDGITWTARWLGGPTYSIQSIAWNGSMFLATTYWQDFLTSTNGISWTPRTHPRINNFAFAAWNGSRWVATCATLGVVVWSSDGISWTEQAMPGAGFDRIAAVGPTFCAFRNSDRHVAISTDGVSWTEYAATGISTSIETLTSANGVFVAGAIDNEFWTSADGVAWTSHALAITKAWHGACFDGIGISMVDSSLGQCVYIRMNLLSIVDPTLDSILLSECVASGLLSAPDIDVTAMSATTVRGYRIGSIGALRAAIEPLQAAWPFDVRQHGYKVQFVARGGASVITIPAADLDARAGGAAPGVQITTSREMDSQIARRVTVQHLDYAREYDAGSQYAERLNTSAVNALVLDLPIVMTSAEAAGVAEVLLYVYWLERHDVAFSLPPTYNQLEPGDVVTLTTPEGNVSLRLTGVSNTSDGRVECTAKYASAAVYTPAALGEPSAVTGTSTVVRVGPSVYVLLDVPMLTSAQSGPSFLAAMTGVYDGWRGGVLMRSRDSGGTWDTLQDFERPGSAIGTCTNSIGVVDSRLIDNASTLSVTMTQGDLFSVTQLALFSGANHFAYGADGRWEIIAAQTCTLISGTSYVLRDLMRGRFGTEWAMGLHAAGDSLVLLDTTDVALIEADSSVIGLAYPYRGITVDRDISTDTDRSFTYRGVNLKPLSPVYLNGNRDAANDWSLSWLRRTRTGGEWRDYVDADLGESSEAYEVDVYADGTYTVVKRTITASTPACAYSSANQVTDFGAPQSTLYLKIYQLSAVVGRGYPLTADITR